MVDFSFISARFLGADDADEVFTTPGEHHPIHICLDPAERNEQEQAFKDADPRRFTLS